MQYNHTQIGHLMIFVLIAVSILFSVIFVQAEYEPLMLTFMLAILFLIASFSTLNVSIDGNKLRIKFGYGIFKKSFDLNEITSAKAVRNHWYYGWGIRLWLWPRIVIFNVSGFDAVEIKMKNGKIYRIGTDEPESLENSLIQSMNLSKQYGK
ncbi:hypothetical protein ACFLZH_02640 [Patescibacteria group bacterium]